MVWESLLVAMKISNRWCKFLADYWEYKIQEVGSHSDERRSRPTPRLRVVVCRIYSVREGKMAYFSSQS